MATKKALCLYNGDIKELQSGDTLDGAGLTIGAAVTGGGANRVLYEDGSQNLAASSGLTFDGTKLQIQTSGGAGEQLRLSTELYGETDRYTQLGTEYAGDFSITPNYGQGKVLVHAALTAGSPKYYTHDVIYGFNANGGWAGRLLYLFNDDGDYSLTVTNNGKVLVNTSDTTGTITASPSNYTSPGIYIHESMGGYQIDGYLRIKCGPSSGYSFADFRNSSDVTQFRVSTTGDTSNHSSPSAALHFIKTTEQMRLGYDTSNYTKVTVASNGAVTFDAVGSGASFTFSDRVDCANFRVVATAGDIASPADGDIWYNSSTNKFRKRENGTTSNLDTTGGGGGLSDGDYGDITVSGSATVFTIDNDVVTYAKMQNVSATDKLLGRSTAGSGDVEEIACTAFGRSLIDDADNTAARSTLGLGSMAVQNAAAVAITGGTAQFDFRGLSTLDSGLDHALTLASGEDLTANRRLSFIVNDASRSLTVAADTTLNGTPLTAAETMIRSFLRC